jgi:hypothetical protein
MVNTGPLRQLWSLPTLIANWNPVHSKAIDELKAEGQLPHRNLWTRQAQEEAPSRIGSGLWIENRYLLPIDKTTHRYTRRWQSR